MNESNDQNSTLESMPKKRNLKGLLGADRVVLIEGTPSKGPLDLLALRKQVHELKRSKDAGASCKLENQVEEDSVEASTGSIQEVAKH